MTVVRSDNLDESLHGQVEQYEEQSVQVTVDSASNTEISEHDTELVSASFCSN
jgi:hypothetical protein